jgi:hypothetical protein
VYFESDSIVAQKIEKIGLNAPTMAQAVPANFINAGTASRLRILLRNKAKLAYFRLNSQTPCVVALSRLTQGRCRRLFHSGRPDRLR